MTNSQRGRLSVGLGMGACFAPVATAWFIIKGIERSPLKSHGEIVGVLVVPAVVYAVFAIGTLVMLFLGIRARAPLAGPVAGVLLSMVALLGLGPALVWAIQQALG